MALRRKPIHANQPLNAAPLLAKKFGQQTPMTDRRYAGKIPPTVTVAMTVQFGATAYVAVIGSMVITPS